MLGNRMKLNFVVNGKNVKMECPPGRRLIDILRLDLKLTGTREGCGRGQCGSCLVLISGNLVNSCLIPAFRLVDADIVTIEGLERIGNIADFQSSLEETHLFQCGYCASGIQMAVAALLIQNPRPGEEEIRAALSGNICHCSAYPAILEGVRRLGKYPKRKRYAKRA